MQYVVALLCCAALVAAWAMSTKRRRDEVACDFARQVLLVDGIADARASPRMLFPYLVRSSRGSSVVLAESQGGAAELCAVDEGDMVAVSCVVTRHRVVDLGGGRWGVAVLPRFLRVLGKPCEHGDDHAH